MSSAGVIRTILEGGFDAGTNDYSWRRSISLSDAGRKFAEARRNPGRGILLDDPYSSALLVMGLREGLVKGDTRGLRRELAKGRNAELQLEMLRALVLFEDVVVPGDKAAEEHFDWAGLQNALGLRITPHLSDRQGIRFRIFNDPAAVLPVGDDRLSAWDSIVSAYLKKRRLPSYPLPDDFGTSSDIGLAIRSYVTAEDLELFIPDIIEFRVKEFIKDRFGLKALDDAHLAATARGAFWRVETFFHLRYLTSLTENEWLPAVVRTRLASVRTLKKVDATSNVEEGFSSGADASHIYSIFLNEILTLPRPETLSEAIEWRSKPHIAEFREVFFRWHEAISAGSADEASLRYELQMISRSSRRLKGWGRAVGIQTYLSVPAAVGLAFVAGPVGAAAGIGLAAIGAVTQKWIGKGSRKNRWMLVGEL